MYWDWDTECEEKPSASPAASAAGAQPSPAPVRLGQLTVVTLGSFSSAKPARRGRGERACRSRPRRRASCSSCQCAAPDAFAPGASGPCFKGFASFLRTILSMYACRCHQEPRIIKDTRAARFSGLSQRFTVRSIGRLPARVPQVPAACLQDTHRPAQTRQRLMARIVDNSGGHDTAVGELPSTRLLRLQPLPHLQRLLSCSSIQGDL
ncbi:unnamed protein product [Symbiodinium natans]|uniref:Uncharacterized protein n=1 Tax=Symbiodinium natans TaxID=878477 RepID=A0A812VE21_9DINO|nr:unnamed protein product [Symbiodinium natans]